MAGLTPLFSRILLASLLFDVGVSVDYDQALAVQVGSFFTVPAVIALLPEIAWPFTDALNDVCPAELPDNLCRSSHS